MKIKLILLIFFIPNVYAFANPIPKKCIKHAQKHLALSASAAVGASLVVVGGAAGAVFVPVAGAAFAVMGFGGLVLASKMAHESNKLHSTMKAINKNKLGWFSRKMAKKAGMSDKEFLSLARANPEIWCDNNKKVRSYGEIKRSLVVLKLKPKILETLSRIDSKCSPAATIRKLKKLGRYNPTRFTRKLTDKEIRDGRGDLRRFGRDIIGWEKISDYIYSMENNFLDPLNHNENNYQYLVHMIRATHSVGLHEHAFFSAEKYLNSLKKTSLSLVDQDDTILFGQGSYGMGIVTWMNSKTLWATSHENMGSDQESLRDLNRMHPIKTPEEILTKRKKKYRYNNEIVSLRGSNILGYLLLKERKTGRVRWELYEPDKLEALQKACDELNLPVVYLKYGKSK